MIQTVKITQPTSKFSVGYLTALGLGTWISADINNNTPTRPVYMTATKIS
jgi:hypothetical protein